MKRVFRVVLPLLLCALMAQAALAEAAPSYDVIYSTENPVPTVAERVRPAVVLVTAKQVNWSKETGEVTTTLGTGSGVYFDQAGYILTNQHVVDMADEYEIEWLDGTVMPATLVGGDSGIDIAVLQFTGETKAEPVPFGDSDALRIGELAIAIGNPGGEQTLFGTVTAGIISGLDRIEMSAGNFTRSTPVIQTDAPINLGNSGGALLNAKGELIGIPTLKYMFSGSAAVFEGLGFAVPSNTAKEVVFQLIGQGKVMRPRLGLMVLAIEGPDRPLRNYAPAGVQIQTVEPGTPAEAAGLKPLDIILSVDGDRVTTIYDLTARVDRLQDGQTLHLSVCRYFDQTGAPLEKWEFLDVDVGAAMMP